MNCNLAHEPDFMILILPLGPHLGTRNQYFYALGGLSHTKWKNVQFWNTFWIVGVLWHEVVKDPGQELAEGLAAYSENAGALHLALKSSNSELMGRRLTSHALRR